jgi:hypothetical protein
MTADENLNPNNLTGDAPQPGEPVEPSSLDTPPIEDQSTEPVDVPNPPTEVPPVIDEHPTPSDETPTNPDDVSDASKVEEELRRAAEEAEAVRLAAEQDLEKKLEALKSEREKVLAEAQMLTDEINVKEEKAAEFSLWVERHRRTFLWKMFAKIRSESNAVVAKQESYAATMSNLELPEPGELIRLRKRFHKTILSVLGISFLVWLVYYLITTFLPFAWVLKFTSFGSTIFRYTLGAAIVFIFSAFVLYYRDWSNFDWRVKKLNKELEDIAKGVDKVRQEEVRLFSLYPQVVDWLEILGYSLNRPWTMNDRWFKSYLSDLNQDEFPFSLRIAQAQESDASAMNKLHGRALKRFATQGWRSKVLKAQVLAIAQKVGLPTERMNVEGLDADIAYSPGGPRSEMRKGLENQDALELVARRQLIPLTYQVQSEEITKARPPVKENRTNILDPIQADQAGLEEEEQIKWDEFLCEPIGPFNGLITPFSIASLAKGQVGYGHHEKMTSHFVVPERLEQEAKKNQDARVETYSETANLPMDIVIRMDLSDTLPPKVIKINSSESIDYHADEIDLITTKTEISDDHEEED